MALPFAFEESVFEEGGEASGGRGPLASPYSARRCEPEWFCEQVNCQDDLERANVRKFRGDLAYKQQEFQRNGATNTDHITAILNLQYAIYCLLEDIEEIIGCLQRLISLHPFHPQTWTLLAEAYMSLLHFPAPLSGTEAGASQGDGFTARSCFRVSSKEASFLSHPTQSQREDDPLSCSVHLNDNFGSCVECQNGQRPNSTLGNSGPRPIMKRASMGQQRLNDICIYSCASFIRARRLFQLTQLTQSSFALESNLKMQQEIEDKVQSFGLEADLLSLMTEAMGEDLVREKLKEDAQEEVQCLSAATLTSIMTASAVEFERKWFQKLSGFSALH
ncbi:uncharacterized protein C8orf76-like isoform 2-T2 [Liasis olivaceus]